MKSNRSNPDEARESVAFCLARIASSPLCFLAVRFLLFDVPEDKEIGAVLACDRVGFVVFDAVVVTEVCLVSERVLLLCFGIDDGDLERLS
jgi:hypothetical protein